MLKYTSCWILQICTASILLAPGEAFSRQLVIGYGWMEKNPLWPKLEKYLSRICQTADENLRCELKFIPFTRLQDLLINGKLDGDLGRLKDGYDGKPSVVLVDEPFTTLNFYAVSHKNRVLEDLDSIRQYKTAVDLGSKMQTKMCEDLRLDCEFVGPGSSSLKMLQVQRIGTVLASQLQIANSGFDNPDFFRVSKKPLYHADIYLFLGKKNEDLAGKMSAAIKQIKLDGSYKQIFNVNP